MESFAVDVALEIKGNAAEALDQLISDMERLDRIVNTARDNVTMLGDGIRALGRAGTSVDKLIAALDKLKGAPALDGPVAAIDKMADATRGMLSATEDLSRVMRNNARFAADTAAALDKAADASRAASRSASRGGTGGHPARGGHDGGGLFGHDVAMAGMGAGIAGAPIVEGTKTALDRAVEMGHQRAMLLSDNRVTPEMADRAEDAAYAATNTAPGSTPVSNMESLTKLRSLTGNLDEAVKMLPAAARLTALLKIIDQKQGAGGHGGDPAYAAEKAAEVLGAMTEDVTDPRTGRTTEVFRPEKLLDVVEKFSKIVSATGGNVDPAQILNFAKQGSTAGITMSDKFLWTELPGIIQVWGGARTGTAMQSLLQVFGPGGKLEPKTAENLVRLGLASPDIVKTTTDRFGKKKTTVDPTKIYGYEKIFSDPLEWSHEASGRMEARGIHGTKKQALEIMSGSQRSTIARAFADFIKDYPALMKEAGNVTNQKGNLFDHYSKNDPAAKLQQFDAAWDKLMTSFGSAALGDAMTVIAALTKAMNSLGDWAKAHPDVARAIADTAAGLGALAVALGGLSTAIFILEPGAKLAGKVFGGAKAGAGVAAGAARTAGEIRWIGPQGSWTTALSKDLDQLAVSTRPFAAGGASEGALATLAGTGLGSLAALGIAVVGLPPLLHRAATALLDAVGIDSSETHRGAGRMLNHDPNFHAPPPGSGPEGSPHGNFFFDWLDRWAHQQTRTGQPGMGGARGLIHRSSYELDTQPPQMIQVHSNIQIDGRAIMSVVTQHVNDLTRNPSMSMTGFNTRLTPMQTGAAARI